MSTATAVEVKERPIIFSGEMVKAILEGRKTQTRRVIKPQPSESWMANGNTNWSEYYKRNRWGRLEKYLWICHPTENREIVCPKGKPGDRLWVKEKWYCAGEHECDGYPVRFEIDAELAAAVSTKWRAPIFMPRWASRITLEITDIRVQRVQEISEADARAEGVAPIPCEPASIVFNTWKAQFRFRDAFKQGWDSINAKRGYSWESNPWVFVIEFRKL